MKPSAVARVGLYGGAFDPPHVAHHRLAQTAIDQLALDVLYVVPTGHAWHKQRPLSPAVHRLAMTRLHFQDLAKVVVDAREMNRDGPSYTLHTLSELQSMHSPNDPWFLLMGQDQWQRFHTWHEWATLAQRVTLAVARRPENAHSADFHPDDMGQGVANANPALSIQWIDMPAMTVSATDIRQRAALGQSLQGLVQESVAQYIQQHHLYQDTHD